MLIRRYASGARQSMALALVPGSGPGTIVDNMAQGGRGRHSQWHARTEEIKKKRK